MHKDQYSVVAARHAAQNQLIWQTPALGLTAQAFLFTIAFGNNMPENRAISSLLIIIVAIATIQLMAKHREYEEHLSRCLRKHEDSMEGYTPIHDKLECIVDKKISGFVKYSSVKLWKYMLSFFAIVGVGSLLAAFVEVYPCVRNWPDWVFVVVVTLLYGVVIGKLWQETSEIVKEFGTPAVSLHLRFTVKPGLREDFLDFLREAIPYYDRRGDSRTRLLEDPADDHRFIEVVEYASQAAYERGEHDVEHDPTMQGLLARWRNLLDGPPTVEVWREMPIRHEA
jgi:quinol monooxygenase YgiN